MIQFTNIEPLSLAVIALGLVLGGRFLYTRISTARFLSRMFTVPSNRAVAWLSVRRTVYASVFTALGLAALAAGLLGPAWGTEKQPLIERKLDILFVVDLSASMNARDVEPSRLEFTKKAIGRFADAAQGARMGILAFAGEPFYYCPYTSDTAAFQEFLDALETRNIGHKGTDFELAFQRAGQIVKNKSINAKVILFFSDGENHAALPGSPLEDSSGEPIPVYVFGVGTLKGGVARIWHHRAGRLVPIQQDGRNVLSKYNPDSLKSLAEQVNARYIWLSKTPSALYNLNSYIPQWGKELSEKGSVHTFTPRGWLFAVVSFIFLSMAFGAQMWRSNALTTLLCAATFGLALNPSPVAAQAGWVDPDYEKLKRANELMASKNPEAALRILQKLAETNKAQQERKSIIYFNKGNAYYEMGNYDAALSDYHTALSASADPILKSKILNNMGNALAQKNEKLKALEAYRAAIDIKRNPEAMRNIERLFQPPQQQQQQQPEQKQNEGKKNSQPQQSKPGDQQKPNLKKPDAYPKDSKPKKKKGDAKSKKLAEQFLRQSGEGRVNRSNSRHNPTGNKKFW